jgi:phage-related protein
MFTNRLLTFGRIFAIMSVNKADRRPVMFNIEFYSTADGVSELWNFLDDLQKKASTSKDARIQHKQIAQYIQLLEDHGTRLGENITKHLEDGIWELRPGNNRVLYFFHKDDTYVLLHQFRKKTQKTPRREIEKAKTERDDWIARKG